MSTVFYEKSLLSATIPEELIHAALDILKSKHQIEPDSECALMFTQKLRELTLDGNVSPTTIMMKVLMLFNQNLSALCDQHEALRNSEQRERQYETQSELARLAPLNHFLN